jgi:hypothetical protein
LPENIRLGPKGRTSTNALDYKNTNVKVFKKIHDLRLNVTKLFRYIIHFDGKLEC